MANIEKVSVALTGEQTAGCAPGEYDMYAVLSRDAAKQTFLLQRVRVSPDIAGAPRDRGQMG